MKNKEILEAIQANVHSIMNGSKTDHQKALDLYSLYNHYEAKLVDDVLYKLQTFPNFINEVLKAVFRPMNKPQFIFYRGEYGDQPHRLIAGMIKGKKGYERRYLVWHRPYGDIFPDEIFSVLWFYEERGMTQGTIETAQNAQGVNNPESLLSMVDFGVNSKVKNGVYKYYVDPTITFDVFKQDVIQYGMNRRKWRNAMDPRKNQYQFIVDGREY